jgi:hypothetical protein
MAACRHTARGKNKCKRRERTQAQSALEREREREREREKGEGRKTYETLMKRWARKATLIDIPGCETSVVSRIAIEIIAFGNSLLAVPWASLTFMDWWYYNSWAQDGLRMISRSLYSKSAGRVRNRKCQANILWKTSYEPYARLCYVYAFSTNIDRREQI